MASAISTAYETGRPTGVCTATGRRLESGERYVAVLIEPAPGAALARQDFSTGAWDEGRRPDPPVRVFAFWRATMSAPGAKKRQLLDDGALLDLFEQLDGATEARKVAFRYLLALVLIRKRLLVLEGTGQGTMRVRHKGTTVAGDRAEGAGIIEVADPGLDPRALEEGTEELSAILATDGGTGP